MDTQRIVPNALCAKDVSIMSRITLTEAFFIGLCLEGFFYGLYSAIFAMFINIQRRASEGGSHKTKNILFYALCVLHVLSVATFIVDISYFFIVFDSDTSELFRVGLIREAVSGCCDFISQSILIYRCWLVAGCNIHVVIIPSILAITFLATWVAPCGSVYIFQDDIQVTYWGYTLSVTSLVISLTVNALVKGLIVFRIFKVYREVKPTLDSRYLGVTGGSKIRSVMFVLIESGVTLLVVQIVRVVLRILQTDNAIEAFGIMVGMHAMLNGITPTIIQVRVVMGLSSHDRESMVEATASLHFASDNPDLKSLDSENEKDWYY